MSTAKSYFLIILCGLTLCLFPQEGRGSLRCENIFKLSDNVDSELRSEQIIFSSAPMASLFSRLEAMTGASSMAESLILLKQNRPKDFVTLKKRLQLITEIIEALSTAGEFHNLDGRIKSILYDEITRTFLETESPHGITSLFRPSDALYFSDNYKTNDAYFVATATEEMKQDWSIKTETRMRISNYVQTLINRSLNSEKSFTHLYSSLMTIRLTFKKGPAGIEEMARHCRRMLEYLDNYDMSFITRINEVPIGEIAEIHAQLDGQLVRLDTFFAQASEEQRKALDLDSLMTKIREANAIINNELTSYDSKVKEISDLAKLWEQLIQK